MRACDEHFWLFRNLFQVPLFVIVDTPPAYAQQRALSDSTAFAGPTNENVEFVGQIGGTTDAVFVAGNYAYVGEGARLTILDITNPASPTVVGKTAPMPRVVRYIYVDGNYAYIADGSGLRVLDISRLTNARRLLRLPWIQQS